MTVTPPRVVSFYINLIDEQIDQLSNHLADDVVLYWYGRTVKGKDLVVNFLIDEIASPEHNITSAKGVSEIGQGTSYSSNANTTTPKEEGCTPFMAGSVVPLGSGCESPPSEEDFPGRKHNESGLQPSNSSLVHNTPDLKMSDQLREGLLHKPRKRKIIPPSRPSMFVNNRHTNLVEAKGSVSYCRIGRYGYRRPWHRECTLQLAYSCPPLGHDPISCCEFSCIIYSDQMKCRRNLCKVFEEMKLKKMEPTD